jgi:hypothetical protein
VSALTSLLAVGHRSRRFGGGHFYVPLLIATATRNGLGYLQRCVYAWANHGEQRYGSQEWISASS